MSRLAVLAASSLALAACHRDAPSPETGTGTAAAPSKPTSSVQGARTPGTKQAPPVCSAERIPWKIDAPGRVVALGDVHGDLRATKAALRAAGIIDLEGRWRGGTSTLVQTGDVLDRGDDELEIYQLFEELSGQAKAAGGRVVLLHGNHELMNASGDFRYVTSGGWEDWSETEVPGTLAAALADVDSDKRGRIAAWAPGGPWAKKVAGQPVIAVVGDSVFAHGGVLPTHLAAIDSLHHSVQCWLLGRGPAPTQVIASDDSPVWTRVYAAASPPCKWVRDVTESLGVKRMVIGHTPQMKGVRSRCQGRLWLIDVGMAAHYGGRPQALVIDEQGARPASAPR